MMPSGGDPMTKTTQTEPAPPARDVERWLDALERILWIGLIAFAAVVAIGVLRQYLATRSVERVVAPSGLIEAERLRITKSREFLFWLQPTTSFGAGWSQDGHMLAGGTEPGDWIELELPAHEPGPQRLEIFLTRASDYGILSLTLNGTPLGGDIDLYSDRVVTTGPIDLGVVELHPSGDVLRVTVMRTNERTTPPHFQFGIDGIRLSPP